MPASVLVTGGAGFIGSHLVQSLLEKGCRVKVIDNLSTGRIANLSRVLGRIEFQLGDVRDEDLVWRSLGGVDCVFHEAAMVSVAQSLRAPWEAFDINARGTLNILRAAVQRGVRRIILASTSAVYGDAADGPIQESARPIPLSVYGAAKLSAESLCGAYANSFGLETISLRYFNVFGPGQDPLSPYAAAVPRFFDAFISGRCPVVYGDGRQTRDFVFVDDVVSANLLGMTAPIARGQAVNIAAGRPTSVNELVALVARVLSVPGRVVYEPPLPGDIRHSMADITVARELLGYTPRVSLEEGLRRVAAWWTGRAAWIPGDSVHSSAPGGLVRHLGITGPDRKVPG